MQPPIARDSSRCPDNPAPTRALVVDDDALLRWAIAQTLVDQDCIVVEASDAAEARRAVEATARPFDTILLDYLLPDSDDLTLLEWMHERSPRSNIVLMTAFGSREVTAGATARGAAAVMNKPFDMSDVRVILPVPANYSPS